MFHVYSCSYMLFERKGTGLGKLSQVNACLHVRLLLDGSRAFRAKSSLGVWATSAVLFPFLELGGALNLELNAQLFNLTTTTLT